MFGLENITQQVPYTAISHDVSLIFLFYFFCGGSKWIGVNWGLWGRAIAILSIVFSLHVTR